MATTTTETKVAAVMALAEGEEIAIDGLVWLCVDASEFKVHREGTEPDAADSETFFVSRWASYVRDVLEEEG